MNSKNSKTSDSHRSLFNLLDQINLKRSDKYVASSNLLITINFITNTFQLKHGGKNLNYLVDHILYQICKITLSI